MKCRLWNSLLLEPWPKAGNYSSKRLADVLAVRPHLPDVTPTVSESFLSRVASSTSNGIRWAKMLHDQVRYQSDKHHQLAELIEKVEVAIRT